MLTKFTFNYENDFHIISASTQGLHSDFMIGLGRYNGDDYSIYIEGDFNEMIHRNLDTLQNIDKSKLFPDTINQCYLCVQGSNHLSNCVVMNTNEVVSCDSYDLYKIPLIQSRNAEGRVELCLSCPNADTYSLMQFNTAYFEIDFYNIVPANTETNKYFKNCMFTLQAPLEKYQYVPKNVVFATGTIVLENNQEMNLRLTDYTTPFVVATDKTLTFSFEGTDYAYTLSSAVAENTYYQIIYHPNCSNDLDPETGQICLEPDPDTIHNHPDGTCPYDFVVYSPKQIESFANNEKINAVITLHGGSWVEGCRCEYEQYRDMIISNNLLHISINYPLLEQGVSYNDILCSISKVIEHVSRILGKDELNEGILDKIAIIGYSAGGHIALIYGLNSNNSISLIVAEGAPTYFAPFEKVIFDYDNELQDYIDNNSNIDAYVLSLDKHNERASLLNQYNVPSPIDYIPNNDDSQTYQKFMLAYALADNDNTGDGVIKYNRATQMAQNLGSSKCSLYKIENCSHGNLSSLLYYDTVDNKIVLKKTNNEDALLYLEKLNKALKSFAQNQQIEF